MKIKILFFYYLLILTQVYVQAFELNHIEQKKLYDEFIKAVQEGNIEKVKQLLEQGANINTKDWCGKKALKIAIYHFNKDMVNFLIEKGADINDYNFLLYQASSFGYKDIAEFLLKNAADADINIKSSIDDSKALTLATHYGHKAIVEILIQNGADINAKDSWGSTPLMIAAEKVNKDLIKFLIQKGADINAYNKKGLTILSFAIIHRFVDIINFLIENGADINARDNDGNTALMHAIKKNYLITSETLLKLGANPNIENKKDQTAYDISVNNKWAKNLLENYFPKKANLEEEKIIPKGIRRRVRNPN